MRISRNRKGSTNWSVRRKTLQYAAVAIILWAAYLVIFLPDGAEYKVRAPYRSSLMSLMEQQPEKKFSKIRFHFVAIEKISPFFRLAVLVAEDIDFPSHNGFAVNEIYNSFIKALSNFRIPRGASTISQQLAKNLYLSPSKSILRKVKEAIITYKIEHTLSKRRIFELYLNVVELGPGVFGVEAASQFWFSKSASALSINEAARLAAILPGPNGAYNPILHAKKVNVRQQILLRRMQHVRLPAGL